MDLDKLERTVRLYTSLIVLEEDLEGYQKSFLERMIEKLLKELDEWPLGTVAEIRNYNLLAFLHLYLRNFDEAQNFVQKAVNVDCRSIIALTNKAWLYLRRQENYRTIRCIFEHLNKTVGTKELELCAKAELAYAYTRFGIQWFNKAVELFSAVLQETKEIRNTTYKWSENVTLWKFGLVLTKQRLLNLYNHADTKSIDISKNKHQEVVKLLLDINKTKGSFESETIRICKARSLVLLGLLINSANNSRYIFINGAKELFVPQLPNYPSADEYAESAKRICPKDSFVLEKCGKIYRYLKKTAYAIDCFKKAIEIKETSFAHHHLALSLKTMIELNHGYHYYGNKNRSTKLKTTLRTFQTHTSASPLTVKPSEGDLCHLTEQLQNQTLSNKHANQEKSNMVPNTHLGSLKIQRSLLNAIKSPKMITQPLEGRKFDNDIAKTFYHLQKSFEIGLNLSAKYDEGILLRQLSRTDEALKSFKIIIQNRDRSNPMLLANVYEQAAFCLLEKIKISQCQNDISDMETDAIRYLTQSVELSCSIVAKVPFLKDCWHGASTLKELVEGKPVTENKLQSMAFLCEKLGNYKDAITCLKQILAEYNSDDPETITMLIDLYIKNGEHNDAILTFDLLRCLPNGINLFNSRKYVSVCIEGALDALKKGEPSMSKIRLKKALTVISPEIYRGQIDDDDEKGYDIYMLCEDSISDKWRGLAELLQETGLKISFNLDDITPGDNFVHGVKTLIKHSRSFIVIVESEEMSEELEMFVSMVLLVKGKKVAIQGSPDIQLPTLLNGVPYTTIEIEKMVHTDKWLDLYIINCVKTILSEIIATV